MQTPPSPTSEHDPANSQKQLSAKEFAEWFSDLVRTHEISMAEDLSFDDEDPNIDHHEKEEPEIEEEVEEEKKEVPLHITLTIQVLGHSLSIL